MGFRRTIAFGGILCSVVLVILLGTAPVFGFIQETITLAAAESETGTPIVSEVVSPSPSPSEEITSTLETKTEVIPEPTPTTVPPTQTEVSQQTVRILVRSNTSVNLPSRMAFSNDQAAIELAKIGVYILDVPASEADSILQDLKNDPNVDFAELNGEVQALEVIPNDPYFPAQSGLTLIRAAQGWAYTTGSDLVTIAIIDTGVDLNHPDLIGKILPGYDFVHNDNIAQDDNGHGTHVAGIAAGGSNNGVGISGVSWGANILPVKVLDFSGFGSYDNVAAAIIWATDNGAQIINLSLGGYYPNETLELAVNYATAHNVLVIAASGNNGTPELLFPAAYRDVVAVGSVNDSKQRSYFSNYGNGLDLMAPGENIYSTIIGGYSYKNGTSMATPFVSGMAAVLWGIPGNGYAYRVETQMEKTALDLGAPGWDAEFGFGLIQMDAALKPLFLMPTPTNTPEPTNTPMPTQLPTYTATAGYYVRPVVFNTLTALPTATQTITPTVTLTLSVVSSSTPVLTESQLPFMTTEADEPSSPSGILSWLPLFCGSGLIFVGAGGMFWAARLKRNTVAGNSRIK